MQHHVLYALSASVFYLESVKDKGKHTFLCGNIYGNSFERRRLYCVCLCLPGPKTETGV